MGPGGRRDRGSRRGRRRRRSSPRHPDLGDYELARRCRRRTARSRELLFCENETNAPRIYGQRPTTPFPKDGINDHVVGGAATVNPARNGHEGRRVVPGHGRARARRPSSGCACGPGRRRRPGRGGRPQRPPRRGVRRDDGAAAAEADDVLRRPAPARTRRDDEAMIMRQAFAGMLWSKQFYALRRHPLARRRPRRRRRRPTRAADRAQRRLAPLRRGRHPVDARQVGVPVVRGVGPRVPRDHARPRRPGVREVPAAGDVPGMVPAPQRRAARLRVVVRRRQPAGPRPRRDRGLADRRPARHGVPGAHLPQAAAQLHVVAQPRRTPRATTCSRAASSGSTT